MNATDADEIHRIERHISELIVALAPTEGRHGRNTEELLSTLSQELLRILRAEIALAGLQSHDEADEVELTMLRVAAYRASVAVDQQAGLRMGQRAAARLEEHVARRTQQLTESNRQLQKLKDDLAAELGAMARLHEFSSRLLSANELQSVLEETLVAVMELQGADFGTVQLNDAEQGGLVMVAHRNFQPAFLKHFAFVRDNDGVCVPAARIRTRVIVEDVELDETFATLRAMAAEAGFRALQSTPLIGHRGELLGVLSTHFKWRHRPTEAELRLTDLYARQATQMIERKRAEEERSNLASIVENSSDFIGIASLAGKVFFLNAAGRRMTGIRGGERIPDDIRSYVAEKEYERVRSQIMPAVERVGFWDGEICLRNLRTGAEIPVLQHVFFIREPQTGRRVALATVCRDITERRRAEHNASKAQQELSHAARVLSMGELTASIAHEINQPLAAIVANGNACRRWIERDEPNLEQARASLSNIVRDANRASEVIQRIRAFSTKTNHSRSPLCVNEVIREVLSLTHHEMLREEIDLVTQLTSGLPKVLADRIELQQVILNLVMNSIEAMRGLAVQPRSLLITSTQAEGSSVKVSVRDNGIGVDAQHLSRLFEAFFTTKADGMGLGLSISRRIIESHGGRMSVESNVVGGLTLSFTLPACREPPNE